MQSTLNFKSSTIVALCFAITMVSALFSEGFHHFDEHFQIFEFMNYKLGKTPVEALPWEFRHQIRSWLLPSFFFPIAKLYHYFGFENPFVFATFVRIIMGAFSFWCTHQLMTSLKKEFNREDHYSLTYLLAQCSWFIPYIHVRTSGENASLALFFLSLSLFFRAKQLAKKSPPILLLFWIGLLSGFIFHLRYQMGMALVGAIAYVIIFHRSWLLMMALGFTISFGLGIIVDYWGHGQWVLASWNYFHENQVLGKSAHFGVTPWWDYFRLVILRGIPPWSLVYFTGAILFIKKNPRHIFTWISIPFFLGHLMVGHKELRFLYFLIALSPIMLGLAVPGLNCHFMQNEKWQRLFKKIFLWGQIPILLLALFSPAQGAIGLYRYIYKNPSLASQIYSAGGNPFQLVTLRPWFYLPAIPSVEEKTVEELQDLAGPFTAFLNRGEQWIKLQKAKKFSCTQNYGPYPAKIWDSHLSQLLSKNRVWLLVSCP